MAQANLETALEKDTPPNKDFSDGYAWLDTTYHAREQKAERRLDLVNGFCNHDPAFSAALAALEIEVVLVEGKSGVLEKELETLED